MKEDTASFLETLKRMFYSLVLVLTFIAGEFIIEELILFAFGREYLEYEIGLIFAKKLSIWGVSLYWIIHILMEIGHWIYSNIIPVFRK